MKRLRDELRRRRLAAEEKAKKVETKSDPTEREHWYGVTEGLQQAINLIDEKGEEQTENFLLKMKDKYGSSEWTIYHKVTRGEEFDFSWLNPQKLVDTFIFKIETEKK